MLVDALTGRFKDTAFLCKGHHTAQVCGKIVPKGWLDKKGVGEGTGDDIRHDTVVRTTRKRLEWGKRGWGNDGSQVFMDQYVARAKGDVTGDLNPFMVSKKCHVRTLLYELLARGTRDPAGNMPSKNICPSNQTNMYIS